MFEDLVGKRVVVVKDRYLWRGEVEGERGPFLVLAPGSTQVIDHDGERVKEEIRVGRCFVPIMGGFDALYEEEGTVWIPQVEAPATRAKKK